jgi:hypothetical protein
MSNPTLMWHVTMAVHEDRVRALQQARRQHRLAAGGRVRRTRALCRLASRHAQIMTARVARRNLSPSRG